MEKERITPKSCIASKNKCGHHMGLTAKFKTRNSHYSLSRWQAPEKQVGISRCQRYKAKHVTMLLIRDDLPRVFLKMSVQTNLIDSWSLFNLCTLADMCTGAKHFHALIIIGVLLLAKTRTCSGAARKCNCPAKHGIWTSNRGLVCWATAPKARCSNQPGVELRTFSHSLHRWSTRKATSNLLKPRIKPRTFTPSG